MSGDIFESLRLIAFWAFPGLLLVFGGISILRRGRFTEVFRQRPLGNHKHKSLPSEVRHLPVQTRVTEGRTASIYGWLAILIGLGLLTRFAVDAIDFLKLGSDSADQIVLVVGLLVSAFIVWRLQ